jgi:hypothetical protein
VLSGGGRLVLEALVLGVGVLTARYILRLVAGRRLRIEDQAYGKYIQYCNLFYNYYYLLANIST